MKSRKGQALVEFVTIIPVFFVILFSAIDLGGIIYKKYHLENDLDYIVELYRQDKLNEINEYSNKSDFVTSISSGSDMVTITLTKQVNINTPGLNVILENPFSISVDRVIYDEE